MGQILGLGITHYPGLAVKGNLARRIKLLLADPALPERLRSPENWPEPMRLQWGHDEGQAHSTAHRQAMIEEFHRMRRELDAFNPDCVILWGDDQYENFHEDCIPAFSVLAYGCVEIKPWDNGRTPGENSWNEPKDRVFVVRGHPECGKFVASALLREGFDIAYAYRPLHSAGLGHAHTYSILFLDWDRQGFPYPVVPFTVNSYGRNLIGRRGRPVTPSQALATDVQEDPPGPQPWRCFQLGGAVARAALRSPWRIALIASSSWSHSFLVRKHALMYPDVESDKRFYESLRSGNWETWRHTTTEEAEDRGHHELLNWYCLAGAMAELGRKPDYTVFQESWITNSDKVFAVFRPHS